MDKLLLRPIEAADAIGLSRSAIYQLLASGELPSIRIGGSVRIPVDKLREWLDRKAAATGSEVATESERMVAAGAAS